MDVFASQSNFLSWKGASEEEISSAECELNLSFSEDYREYLSVFGIAAFDGHEITGLTNSRRLNVVSVTLEARQRYPELSEEFYVMEETGVEEYIVLQKTDGAVYGCAPNYRLEKKYNSLCEYFTCNMS